jgi:hypothetical protein
LVDAGTGGLQIQLVNFSASSVTFWATNGYAGNAVASYVVPAHSTNLVDAGSATNSGLYDLTVAAGADGSFVRRFLGRVQKTLPVAPFIAATGAVPAGRFQFVYAGPPSQSYHILSSTNLSQAGGWTVAASGTFGTAPGVFTEPGPMGQSVRFYRVISP